MVAIAEDAAEVVAEVVAEVIAAECVGVCLTPVQLPTLENAAVVVAVAPCPSVTDRSSAAPYLILNIKK